MLRRPAGRPTLVAKLLGRQGGCSEAQHPRWEMSLGTTEKSLAPSS